MGASDAGVDLDVEWYRHLYRQAFKGLEHLHQNCIVHCDIKEPNLMVKSDDFEEPEVVIIDLGLSSAFHTLNNVSGTPGYMPPETWQKGDWFPRGDVFSMGVVCCQMLTGRVPNEKINL